ncbi:pyridoxal phosphate-dependent aminotransferase [Umezawaea sp. Da 62-37]|uniref:pyridoxal phosphate-dependent aminotransferase n=1 Tax=Umezawaea sp. Da 62-37 TaxID=3075927 RepID=UPI0028F70533|nr:pyridoxal phosphate-dependent aminotransferase [Umezawaea sp. Da 62-37]WNV84988.1 pyridoxal phosphate-dependent aminotransferase [Umezawaea sp. Da 62-37]
MTAEVLPPTALFARLPETTAVPFPIPPAAAPAPSGGHDLDPAVGDRLIDLYSRVSDPTDPLALRDLFLSRVEAEVVGGRREVADLWRSSRPRRTVTGDEVLGSRATVRFVKELFNSYFRDDLYGRLRSDRHLILSSGSVDETCFGLPATLRSCLSYAVDRDWYGYSDSRGRRATREAIAEFENATVAGSPYDVGNVCLTLGGTFGVSAVADFVLGSSTAHRPEEAAPALCGLPNYPPLMEAVAKRSSVRLVPLVCASGNGTSLRPLIEQLTPATPLVLLQTVTNPTGTAVAEDELERLIRAAGPHTTIVLDEAHECLGPLRRSALRADPRVVRVVSLSKSLSTPGLKLGWLVAGREFVDEFYEYASTSYGGPASVFYLLIEVMARMERWRVEGLVGIGRVELAEFERTYGLTTESLGRAHRSYLSDRERRDRALVVQRDRAADTLLSMGFDVVRPTHSINIAVRPHGCDDGYLWFREALADARVAVYPAILNGCLNGGWVRVSTAGEPGGLATAIRALRSLARG